MTALVLYPLLTAALYYLGSRAVITQALWSRYPPRLAAFMDCPYCTGTWYGALVALIGGFYLDLDFLALAGDAWPTIVVVALCSMMWTPMVAAVAQHSFYVLGTALGTESSEPISPILTDPPEEPHDGEP